VRRLNMIEILLHLLVKAQLQVTSARGRSSYIRVMDPGECIEKPLSTQRGR
jgi:hypothetical protein